MPLRRKKRFRPSHAALYVPAAAAASTTWNPSDKSSRVNLSNGNLTMTLNTSNYGAVRSVAATTTSQKVYVEFVLDVKVFATNYGFSQAAAGNLDLQQPAGDTPSAGFYFRNVSQVFYCQDSANQTPRSVLPMPLTFFVWHLTPLPAGYGFVKITGLCLTLVIPWLGPTATRFRFRDPTTQSRKAAIPESKSLPSSLQGLGPTLRHLTQLAA
jgi:hypothetical protein